MARAGVPVKFYEAELEQFDRCPPAKKKIESYVNKLSMAFEKGVGLYLCGSQGLGKSFCEAIIAKSALRKGYSVLYTNLNEVITQFGDGFYDKEVRDAYRHEVLQVDFLIVDDIDKTLMNTEKSISYIAAAFDQLFRTRSNELLPTILSANKTREEFFKNSTGTFGASALSLLAEHLIDVLFIGKDKRAQINPELVQLFLE
jgi:DNA replication protein DnaC